MAVWQYNLRLIPKKVILDSIGTIPDTITEEMLDQLPSWDDTSYRKEMIRLIEQNLPRAKSWSKSITMWGEEESHCIEFLYSNHNLSEISIRLDLRSLRSALLESVESLGRISTSVGVNEDGLIFDPNLTTITNDIKKSEAYKFLKNPEYFISNLTSK